MRAASARLPAWLVCAVASALTLGLAAALHEPAEHRLAKEPALPPSATPPAASAPAPATSAPLASLDPPGTSVRVGSIYLPRGGPTIIGFLSPGPARLQVGEHELRGQGLVKRRVIWPDAGPLAVRFAAPPGARLLWNPPGRRGAPEYVPASSLSPDPPPRARFGAGVGAAWRDAAFAWAATLLALCALILGARRRLSAVASSTWAAMAAVLVVAVAARLFGLGAAGQTWDEDVYWTAGRNLVQNLLELRLDAWWWRWNSEHPPVSKYLAGLGALLWDGFGPARGVAVVVSSLSCALLVPIGARLGARGAGLLAGLVAALTPHLIAHGQLVGHESPSLLWWTLGVLLALDVHRPGDAAVVPLRALVLRLAAVSVVVGLAVSTRFIGALLGPAAVTVIGAWAPAGQRRRAVAVALLVVPLGSLATFFALWPWLWDSPVARLQESWSVLRAAVGPEPYLGALTSYPPRSYFVRYLFATTPVGVLLAAALWALHAVATGWSRRPASAGTAAQQSWPAMVTVLAWLALPLVVCLSPVRKDGVRYVIPVVQGLSLVAGLGVAAVVARCSRRAALLAGAALVSYLLWSCVRAQPYYLDYYNELTGGAAQVSRDRAFETAWWGEGVDRAVAYVNQHAARGARVARSCVAPAHVGWFRGDLWTPMAQAPHEAEWIVAYAPRSYPCPVPADAQLVFAVTHRGLVLAEVYRRAAPR